MSGLLFLGRGCGAEFGRGLGDGRDKIGKSRTVLPVFWLQHIPVVSPTDLVKTKASESREDKNLIYLLSSLPGRDLGLEACRDLPQGLG